MELRHRNQLLYADKFSLLDEMSSKGMSNYRPDQIATILRQREYVSRDA